jgi:transcriptional regulator with XRE-family HTH domain
MNDIGKKLKKLREARGLTQENLADDLGMAQPSYQRLEKNSENIKVSTLIQIANILKTSVSEILGEQIKNINIVENNNDNSNAYFDSVVNADKDHIDSLKSEIAFLRKILEQQTNEG